MRRWLAMDIRGIDQHIEGEDRDDEPREPPCKECGGYDGDHPVTCSYHPDYYEPRDEWDSPCDEDDYAI